MSVFMHSHQETQSSLLLLEILWSLLPLLGMSVFSMMAVWVLLHEGADICIRFRAFFLMSQYFWKAWLPKPLTTEITRWIWALKVWPKIILGHDERTQFSHNSLSVCLLRSYVDGLWYPKVKSLSHVQLFATLWTVAHQAPLSMGFSRQEYWSGLAFPSPGDLPDPGIEPRSPALQADGLTSEKLFL